MQNLINFGLTLTVYVLSPHYEYFDKLAEHVRRHSFNRLPVTPYDRCMSRSSRWWQCCAAHSRSTMVTALIFVIIFFVVRRFVLGVCRNLKSRKFNEIWCRAAERSSRASWRSERWPGCRYHLGDGRRSKEIWSRSYDCAVVEDTSSGARSSSGVVSSRLGVVDDVSLRCGSRCDVVDRAGCIVTIMMTTNFDECRRWWWRSTYRAVGAVVDDRQLRTAIHNWRIPIHQCRNLPNMKKINHLNCYDKSKLYIVWMLKQKGLNAQLLVELKAIKL